MNHGRFYIALIIFATAVLLPQIRGDVFVFAQIPEIAQILNQSLSSNASSTIGIVSEVENVTVTKFDILAPDTIGIDLRYAGAGDAPPVEIEANAIHINSELIDDLLNEIESLNASSGDINSSVNTSSINSTSQMIESFEQLSTILSTSNGTLSIDAGWKSPASGTLKLVGNASLYDAPIIGVLVHE